MDYEEDGIFLYTKAEADSDFVGKCHFSGEMGEREIMQIVAYLMELLAYDLAMAPSRR